jgi:hypothetical protein
VWITKASVSEPLMTCRKTLVDIETGDALEPRDEPGGCPVDWPGGVRRGGGASVVWALMRSAAGCTSNSSTSALTIGAPSSSTGPSSRKAPRVVRALQRSLDVDRWGPTMAALTAKSWRPEALTG